jgi:hypothetical protein
MTAALECSRGDTCLQSKWCDSRERPAIAFGAGTVTRDEAGKSVVERRSMRDLAVSTSSPPEVTVSVDRISHLIPYGPHTGFDSRRMLF